MMMMRMKNKLEWVEKYPRAMKAEKEKETKIRLEESQMMKVVDICCVFLRFLCVFRGKKVHIMCYFRYCHAVVQVADSVKSKKVERSDFAGSSRAMFDDQHHLVRIGGAGELQLALDRSEI